MVCMGGVCGHGSMRCGKCRGNGPRPHAASNAGSVQPLLESIAQEFNMSFQVGAWSVYLQCSAAPHGSGHASLCPPPRLPSTSPARVVHFLVERMLNLRISHSFALHTEVCGHTRARTPPHMLTDAHAYAHAHAHTHAHRCTCTCTRACTYTCAQMHMHMYTHMRMRTNALALTHDTPVHAQVGYSDGASSGVGWGLAAGLNNRLASNPTPLSPDTPVRSAGLLILCTFDTAGQVVVRSCLICDNHQHMVGVLSRFPAVERQCSTSGAA